MRYTVGELARALGLTPGALHYYEREGLLVPQRAENGHRCYDEASMWRLLSYEKYHSMEYPMKTVIDQFTGNGSKEMIRARVRERRDEAMRKSEYYRQLAESIQDHIDAQDRIGELLGHYAFERSRDQYFWHADNGWMSPVRAQQDEAARWVAAMPTAQIAVIWRLSDFSDREKEGLTVFGYSIEPEKARAIRFELPPDAAFRPGCSSLHTVVIRPHEFVYRPEMAFEDALDYAAARGFRLAGTPGARVLMVETMPDGAFNAYLDVWIPIM